MHRITRGLLWLCASPSCATDNVAIAPLCRKCRAWREDCTPLPPQPQPPLVIPSPTLRPLVTPRVALWPCPNCSAVNLPNEQVCYNCETRMWVLEAPKVEEVQPPPPSKVPLRPPTNVTPKRRGTDWMCDGCNFVNFRQRVACMACGRKRPMSVGLVPVGADAEGDVLPLWSCKSCSAVQEAVASMQCNMCLKLREGIWRCQACKRMNLPMKRWCVVCMKPRRK